MTGADNWDERSRSVIAEKLPGQEAKVLFDLIAEAPERFITTLQEFIDTSESDVKESTQT